MTTRQEVEIARRKYARIKNAFIAEGNQYHDPAPLLPQDLIENCSLLCHRFKLLERLPKGGVCAEIGTDRSDFAKRILETCKPEKLYLFEIDISRIHRPNIDTAVQKGQCEVIEGDSKETLANFSSSFFDWIYIDGDHYYDGVKKDIELAAEKLKPGGMIVLNDYAAWSPVGMTHCGVARAVNEFCIENKYEVIFFAFQTMMYNDVAIRAAQ